MRRHCNTKLEGANIKLASVATDLLGRSGRALLEALVAGATDPAALAQLAKGRLRTKIADLERGLRQNSDDSLVGATGVW